MLKVDQSEVLRCKFCKNYFVEPIVLACGESLCKKHVNMMKNDLNNNGSNVYKCLICNENHKSPENGFSLNIVLNDLLKLNFYLDEHVVTEVKLIDEFETVIQDFRSLCKAPNNFIREQMAEERNKIEIRREKLIEKIQTVSNELLNELKEFEDDCLNETLKKNASDLNDKYLKELDNQENKIESWREEITAPRLSKQRVEELLNETRKNLVDFKQKSFGYKNKLFKGKGFYFESSKLQFDRMDFGNLIIDEYKAIDSLEANKNGVNFSDSFEANDSALSLSDSFELNKSPASLCDSFEPNKSVVNSLNSFEVNKMVVNSFESNKSAVNHLDSFEVNKVAVNQLNSFEINKITVNQLNSNEANKNPFDSTILASYSQSINLIKLCGFNLNTKFKLLYRATRDGFSASDFHAKCDNITPTLSIVKARNSNVFGGYTEQTWDGKDEVKTDNKAFLFSLVNADAHPIKIHLEENDEYSIYCNPSFCIVFGGDDLCIKTNSNEFNESYSDLGSYCSHPTYIYESSEAQSFFAGSYKFMTSEIEVYQVE